MHESLLFSWLVYIGSCLWVALQIQKGAIYEVALKTCSKCALIIEWACKIMEKQLRVCSTKEALAVAGGTQVCRARHTCINVVWGTKALYVEWLTLCEKIMKKKKKHVVCGYGKRGSFDQGKHAINFFCAICINHVVQINISSIAYYVLMK